MITQGKMKVLPFLPGFNVDDKKRENFHKTQHFDKMADGVYYLADKPKFADLKNPPIYATEHKVVPTWITHDKQRLAFKAYFEEETGDSYWTSTRRRHVNIFFFLEDGTMKISEPFTSNSGMEQGVLVKRQKIPVPEQIESRYYEISDLNIGKELTIFGRIYYIFDCDQFTRTFLTRMGIPVPDAILIDTSDETEEKTQKDIVLEKSEKEDSLSKFLKYDRQVLRFYGYWDDDSPHGIMHDLEIYYYLADDMVEIKEILPTKMVKNYGAMYIRKTKIPKLFTQLNPIGADEKFTVLNIMKKDHPRAKNYFVLDPLKTGVQKTDYYSEIDFFIGAEINVYGRKVVITDLDPFTKDYYKKKYGIEEFVPLKRPDENDQKNKFTEKYIPPYNGFGSYEDSLGNCFSIIPKPPKINFIKFYRFGDHVLRFRAKMISKYSENSEREFIIRFFLMDDTISVFELSSEKSGFQRHLFQNRMQVMLPDQEIFTNKKPSYYDKTYFYVGSQVNLNGFVFELVSADLNALRYMENNASEFPKANAKLIMKKIRECLRPVYKEFIQQYCPNLNTDNPIWESDKLRQALKRYLGDNIIEHEIITIARKYSSREKKEFHTREYVRTLVHNELNRNLWNKLDRLEGNVLHFDRNRSGYLSRKELYSILRGSQIPLNVELLNSMLDHLNKNEEGKIDCRDLLRFMNVKIDPTLPVPPIDMKTALWWASEKEPDCGTGVDWRAFLKDLDLSEEEGSESKSITY